MIKRGKFIFTQPYSGQPGRWMMQQGDALRHLMGLPSGIANEIVTSPPYKNKVDYGVDGQYGLEPSVQEYRGTQRAIAAELLRIAAPDAVMFWVIQDTFNGSGSTGGDYRHPDGDYRFQVKGAREEGVPRKAQLLIPEYTRIDFAEVGWHPTLRITWDKKDSRRGAADRPSHSYEDVLVFSASESAIVCDSEDILLFAKNPDHFWNRNAVLQEYSTKTAAQLKRPFKGKGRRDYAAHGQENPCDTKRRMIKRINGRPGAYLRSVWEIPSEPAPVIRVGDRDIPGVATFPLLLAEICIALGSKPGDLVLDPYAGMGSTILAASRSGRPAVGIELNPRTLAAAKQRMANEGLAEYEDSKPWLREWDGDQANALRAMSL